MSKVIIKKLNDGPFVVYGEAELQDGSGKVFQTKEGFAICRCGHTKGQPFCDGAHQKIEFKEDSQA